MGWVQFRLGNADEALDLEATVKETFDGLPLGKKLTAAQLAGVLGELFDKPTIDRLLTKKVRLLSGGQKQRIGLARAFLNSAPVLVLDDPISQVDTATGQIIIDAIRNVAGRKTIIIVSHRLSALRFADRIISFEKGSLIESGSHAELLKNGGYYAGVFALQELEDAV